MKIFLDANVLVSVLNKEYPGFTYTSRVLSLADFSEYKLYTSPVYLAIAYYFAEKKCGNTHARHKIELIMSKLNITTVNDKIARETLLNKKIHDFEDGLQYYSAIHSGCKYIITEDLNDYYFSEIEVMTGRQFLERIVF